MRQIYSEANNRPIFDTVVEEIDKLKNLPVLRWYRGMAHTLHIHFGKSNAEMVSNKAGDREIVSGDYSLFLHGEWELSNQSNNISSLLTESEQIDTFIEVHKLASCADVVVDRVERKLHISFADGTKLTAFDRDNAWFVFEKFGEYSYSPKGDAQVEVSRITLEK